MKRLALKISKELSIDMEHRVTDGQAFLTDCFAEFNTALEQGNPIERKLQDHLALQGLSAGTTQPPSPSIRKVADQLLALAGKAVPRISIGGGSTPEVDEV